MRSAARWLILALLLSAATWVIVTLGPRVRGQRRLAEQDPRIRVESLTDDTTTDPDGAVRSVQTGDVWLPEAQINVSWTPENLERLARTYWFHLGRMSGGLLRVMYTPHGRAMALFGLIPLITFHEPEYELGADRSSVRWRIRRGLLVAQRTSDRDGYLQIVVERRESNRPGMARIHVQVSIANFYPAIAESLSRRLYEITQSRIHVYAVTGFLRSLARGELVPSKVGRFAQWPMEASERAEALRERRPARRGVGD